MSNPDDLPEGAAQLLEEAFQVFMRGNWTSLGITGEQEQRLNARMHRYVAQSRAIPSHLLYQARQVWDENKYRILADWEAKLDKAWADQDSSVNRCETCPNCGCSGME